MNKKSIILTISIIVLGFLAFMATNLVRNSGKSDTELLDFSIADTSSVDKIIMTDAFANRFQLIKKDGIWIDSAGNCIIQEPVHTILETFKNVEFKGYVPENSRKTITNRMSGTHTKVEIYQNGEWSKTWFVGFSTQDHYGTYMLLETPDKKSDLPVIMKIKGFNGIIEPRFFCDPRRWKCTEIFALERDQIASVDVRFFDEPTRSFSVSQNGSNYTVKHFKTFLPAVDTNMVIRYLNNYKKIHYEFVNYDLTDKQVDSVKRSKAFCMLTLKEISGKSNVLKMYRMKGTGELNMNEFGDSIAYNADRFWCLLPSGDLVKCQYFVFNPLIMGHIYFAQKPEAMEM
jgi:hypothetical protein